MDSGAGATSRLQSLLDLLRHVCLPPDISSALGASSGHGKGPDLGGSLTIFRSAILRVITHLTSGVAGSHIALDIASTGSSTASSTAHSSSPNCLSSLLSFLGYQAKLVRDLSTAAGDSRSSCKPASEPETAAMLDFFSFGLCLESLKNLMAMEAIPYSVMISLVKNITVTFQYCDDMRVLCAAANLLSTMLSILTASTVDDCDDGSTMLDGEDSSRRPLCQYTSDERMHVVHHICTHVASDDRISASLSHIFQFFLFNKSSSASSASAGVRAKFREHATELAAEEPLTPSASSCDPSMWLLGNEFGMRTGGILLTMASLPYC